jgi:hypothetical protein
LPFSAERPSWLALHESFALVPMVVVSMAAAGVVTTVAMDGEK